MNNKTIKILFIEEYFEDVVLFQELIKEIKDVQFELVHVEGLSEALIQLGKEKFDIVLMDISLKDAQGPETVTRVCDQAPDVPVVVMTVTEDETMAIKALQMGAEDYIVKGHIKSHSLERIIQYAIMRHKTRTEIRALSLVDDLTGLYNQQGFLLFAQQQLSLSERTKRGMILFIIKIDNLKELNDIQGHNYRDTALIEIANILKDIFRASDIIGRFGENEFTAIAIESFKASEELITTRLHEKVNDHNNQENCLYRLSMSIGTAYYDTEQLCSIEELIKQATNASMH